MKELLSIPNIASDSASSLFIILFSSTPKSPIASTLWYLISKYSTYFSFQYLFPEDIISAKTNFYLKIAEDLTSSFLYTFIASFFMGSQNWFENFLLANTANQIGTTLEMLLMEYYNK